MADREKNGSGSGILSKSKAQKDILSAVAQKEALRPAHITPGTVTAEELLNAGPPAKTTLSDDHPLNHLTLITPRRKAHPLETKKKRVTRFEKVLYLLNNSIQLREVVE
ncbi:hypothetical protein RUM43_007337, partial [Polyplax serrata]